MNVNDNIVSPDGLLKVTLVWYEPRTGKGRIRIEELLPKEHARFYVTVSYGDAGQARIDYKTYDVKKAPEFDFTALPNDAVTGIKIVSVPAD
jgi:hypothetical protein